MKQVSGYRRITTIGTTQGIYISTLIKNTGFKTGDIVRVTIEEVESNEGESQDGTGDS